MALLNSQKYQDAVKKSQFANILQVVETSATEYPCDWQCAVIGFDTWEQIQAFCNEEQFRDGKGIFAKSKATPVIFHRRDGRQFWDRTGHTAYNPFRSSDEDIIGDGSRYMVYHRSDFKDYEDFREQEITPFIDEDDEDELSENDQQIIRNANALWEGLESCDENHAVRYDGVNGYAEIIELNCIKYYDDGHCYLIGVEINFQDDEEDKENEDYSLNK